MPITKSAKKSLKVSRTKAAQNRKTEVTLEKALRGVNKDNVSEVISTIDKAAKTNLIHKNKAARLKSELTKKFGTEKKNQTSKVKDQNDKVKSKKKPVKKD